MLSKLWHVAPGVACASEELNEKVKSSEVPVKLTPVNAVNDAEALASRWVWDILLSFTYTRSIQSIEH